MFKKNFFIVTILVAVLTVFVLTKKIEATDQMLANPGFEEVTGSEPADWYIATSGGGAGSLANFEAHRTGNRGLWIYTGWENWGEWSARYQEFSSSPGKIYTGKGYVRSHPDEWVSGTKAFIRIEFWNNGPHSNNDTYRIAYYDSPAIESPDSNWQEFSVTSPGAPDGTVYVRFCPYVLKPTSEGVSTANFDDCFFEEADTTPPTAPGEVRDGTGADIDFISSNTQLSANWDVASDPDSGIVKYFYAIGTSPGNTDVVNWTDNGNSTSVTRTGLSLASGTIYYFSVKAENGSGLQGPAANSDGQKVDTSPPSTPIVTDDGDYTTSTTKLHASWASTDEQSSIVENQYAIGTTEGATNIVGWTLTGTEQQITKDGLSLTEGETYYFAVKVKNAADLWSGVGASDGITIDSSVPTAPGTPTDSGEYTTSTNVSWNWTASSAGASGIKTYYVCIGTTPGGTDIVNDLNIGNVLTYAKTGLTHGNTYYAKVKAESNNGRVGAYSGNSDGITIDTSPPGAPGIPVDEAQIVSNNILNFTWTQAQDSESGVVSYWLYIGTSPGASDIFNAEVGNILSYAIAGTEDKMYFARVRAKNGAGVWGDFSASSDGISIDMTKLISFYSVYSDEGLPPDVTQITKLKGDETLSELNNQGDTPEGTKYFKTQVNGGWGGFYISVPTQVDLSYHRNNNGLIKFWVRSSVNLVIKIKDANNNETGEIIVYSTGNAWQEKQIALSDFPNAGTLDFTKIKNVFLVAAQTNTAFYIDRVRWVVPFTAPAWASSFNVQTDSGSAGFIGVYKGASDSFSITDDTLTYKEGAKSTKATYNISSVGWGGWFVQEGGEESSTSRFMSAYDRGSAYLHFWIKTDKDAQIGIRSQNITAGQERSKIILSDYRILLDNTWQEVYISLKDFKNKEPNLDFSQMKIYFNAALVGAKVGAVSGDFWVDDIRWFTLQSTIADENKIYQGLVDKQNSTTKLVQSYQNRVEAFTYDQALAAITYIFKGDLQKATDIFDTCQGFYNSGFDGFYESYNVENKSIIDSSRFAGPNAWMLEALIYYKAVTKNTTYDTMMVGLANWLINLQDADGGIKKGYNTEGSAYTSKSTEHNLSCYSTFKNLYTLTENETYNTVANNIKSWLDTYMWILSESRFKTGSDAASTDKALDCYSFAVSSLGDSYASVLTGAQNDFRTTKTCDLTGEDIDGFDAGGAYGEAVNKDAVWLEGTAQMALSFYEVADESSYNHFIAELEKTVVDLNENSQGMAYATNAGTTYGGGIMDSTNPCVSSVAWYIFAKNKFNPFSPFPELEVTIKNISDNNSYSQLEWSGVSLPVTWKVANQYIEISVKPKQPSWGIQIYTDNKSTDANPKYTGSGNPCGLVAQDNTTKVLPLCWRIEDAISTPAEPIERQDSSGFTDYSWKWMKDRDTAGFEDGHYYQTVWDENGILWGEADTQRSPDALSPNFIYVAAKFKDALTPRTYKTNKLILELYCP